MDHVRARRALAGVLAAVTTAALGACTPQDNGNNTLVGAEPHVAATVPAKGGGIDLEAKDNEFVPLEVLAKAGDIVITMRNTGLAPHTFTNTELAVDQNADAGKTVEITLKGVKAGNYTFICKYHEALKMVGELKVS